MVMTEAARWKMIAAEAGHDIGLLLGAVIHVAEALTEVLDSAEAELMPDETLARWRYERDKARDTAQGLLDKWQPDSLKQ